MTSTSPLITTLATSARGAGLPLYFLDDLSLQVCKVQTGVSRPEGVVKVANSLRESHSVKNITGFS